MRTLCPSCREETIYESIRPVFCGHCGERWQSSASSPTRSYSPVPYSYRPIPVYQAETIPKFSAADIVFDAPSKTQGIKLSEALQEPSVGNLNLPKMTKEQLDAYKQKMNSRRTVISDDSDDS